MESFGSLLLDVWREASQHLGIRDSVTRIAELLRPHLPLAALLVRRLDLQRSCLETVAVEAGRVPEQVRSDCAPADLQRLLLWCRRQDVFHGPACRAADFLPGLLPAQVEGDVLAGPLATEEGPLGTLAVLARPNVIFGAADRELFKTLLGPFTVALQNDRRFRELTALREAVEADNRSLLSRLDRHDISECIVGSESGLRHVMEQVGLVARSDVPVLILGETGSGKEVVARSIHTLSGRPSGPFLRVNCGAIPSELVDSELFGHERGSFTGAVGVRQGWFERADGGTLFLDECGELPLAAQVRLLRILQDGSFQRVGGEKQLNVDVRIVAATHRDLQLMVSDGRFREDLWYRIGVFPIRLPPLRERRQDIPALAAHFALRAAKRLGVVALTPTTADVNLLASYHWPGNVRELAAVIERAAILGDGKLLRVADALGVTAPRELIRKVDEKTLAPVSEEIVPLDVALARHIERALQRTQGRIEGPGGAAQLLKINPHTLRARMRKLGLDWTQFRAKSA